MDSFSNQLTCELTKTYKQYEFLFDEDFDKANCNNDSNSQPESSKGVQAAELLANNSNQIMNKLDWNMDGQLGKNELELGLYSITNAGENPIVDALTKANPEWLPSLKILNDHFDSIKGITNQASPIALQKGLTTKDMTQVGQFALSRIKQEDSFASAKQFAAQNFQDIDSNKDGKVSSEELTSFSPQSSVGNEGYYNLKDAYTRMNQREFFNSGTSKDAFSLEAIQNFDVAFNHRESMKSTIKDYATERPPNIDKAVRGIMTLGAIGAVFGGFSIPASASAAAIAYGALKVAEFSTNRIAVNRRLNNLENHILPEFLD